MLYEALQKMGFNDKEATCYLALLELGPQPASVVGKQANINRSTTYMILSDLIKKGYVNQHMKAEVKYFSAANPSTLIKNLDTKERKIAGLKNEVKGLLPQFNMLSNPLGITPKVKLYEGETGVKKVMDTSLKSSEPIRTWHTLDAWFNSGPVLKEYIQDYGMQRALKYKINEKILIFDTPLAKQYFLNDHPVLIQNKETLLDIRWIKSGETPFMTEINVFDDKVCMVSLEKTELVGVIIESHEIAKSHKTMFELQWEISKEIKAKK